MEHGYRGLLLGANAMRMFNIRAKEQVPFVSNMRSL